MPGLEIDADPGTVERNWPVWRPLFAVMLVSLFIREFAIDQAVSAKFYDSVRHEWPFERAEPMLWFYRNGTIPPIILGCAGALVALFGGWFSFTTDRHRKSLRRNGLFLALLLVIGPGLLVNVSLKDGWGRPRPLQCQEFGGEMTFLPVGQWAVRGFPNSSFPSGHAAVAFCLMGPAFVTGSHRKLLRRRLVASGIGYGTAMGCTRIMQGGHFLSDVIWAGAIVYFVGVGLTKLMFPQAAAAITITQSGGVSSVSDQAA